MALIVENGTGLPDSESYISVADADTYHTNRGNVDWAALTTPEKEAALRKAADYLVQTYRSRWMGEPTELNQALDWPRDDVPHPNDPDQEYPDDVVPVEVKRANADLALLSLTEDLNGDTERLTTGEQVGSIRVTYDRGAADKRRYPAIEGTLRVFLVAGGAASIVRG